MTNDKKNAAKNLAVLFAHQLDDERKINEGFYPQLLIDGVKDCGQKLRMDIVKSGYDIELILHYVEEYKKLSMQEYVRWIYE